MSLPFHTIDMVPGSDAPAMADRLLIGKLADYPVPGPIGELTGAVVNAVGSGYTSIPTVTAATGSGATIAASMALATSVAATSGGAASHSYVPGDTLTLTGGTASQQAILEVLSTLLVNGTVGGGGGSGYAVNDTITLLAVGGTTVTPAVLKVASLSTTAVATFTVQTAGSFTGNPTSFTQASSSGAGTGCTLTSPIFGVNAYAVQNAGSYSALPASPIAQGSSSGAGTGFTLTANTWQVQSVSASGGINYPNGAALTFTGGVGSGAAGVAVTQPLGKSITIPVTTFSGLPASYAVSVIPNGDCDPIVSSKTSAGFSVTLRPSSATTAVGASSVDIIVIG